MIGVCGSGSWGTALAMVLAKNLQQVYLWGRNPDVLADINEKHSNTKYLPGIKLPENIIACSKLVELCANCKDILICVPSKGFSEFLSILSEHVTNQHRFIWATKGLDKDTGLWLDELLANKLSNSARAILSGPSFAKEVALDKPTAVTIGCRDSKFSSDIVKYFHNPNFRLYTTTDVVGVQLGGVMKNILAVACGLSDGLENGANTRAALITRGLAETMRLALAIEAKMETITGLSGIGDIILSCTDDQSRNRKLGLLLAQGNTTKQALQIIQQSVESVSNVKLVQQLATRYQVEMPITEKVAEILSDEITVVDAMHALLSRKPKIETIT